MKDTQTKKTSIAGLRKGRIKGIGLFERATLVIAGRIDGMRGLPREDVAGNWLSPRLDRETRAYDEFCSRRWGRLQIDEEESYARMGELTDSIAHTGALLEAAQTALTAACAEEETADVSRRHGEDGLSDGQVAARRANEQEKRLAPLRNDVSTLQSRLTSEIDALSTLRNRILEDNHSARMVCARVRDHLYQRMDVYWAAALRKHPENAKMPAVPHVEVSSRAEENYLAPHRFLLQRTEQLVQAAKNEEEAA